jgi:Flagellar biosynthesis/type III secretory pathway ATPase
LEVYLDGEAGERNDEHVREHLMKCASCESAFEALTAENELFVRYDRELEVSPAVWNGIAARIAAEGNGAGKSKSSFSEWFAGLFAMPSFRFAAPAVAFALIAIVIGVAYWRTRPESAPPNKVAQQDNAPLPTPKSDDSQQTAVPGSAGPVKDDEQQPILVAQNDKRSPVKRPHSNIETSDVIFTEASDMEDKDTASHLEQAQNLLISVRSIQMADDDQEVDVSYEKSESRRLLNENIVLRRDAEMAGKFPAKSVLGSLEPFLIDIANLPDKAPAKDIRQIRDRVQKTEIVAELRAYEE